ncbi:MAG: hypothetical protein ABII23_03730 [bacterium]
MKKWLIIGVISAIIFNVGWRFFVNYMHEKKGIPKSHIIGYLIYRDKYLPGKSIVTMKGDKEKEKTAEKDAVQPKAAKPKTQESVKSEYDARLKKTTNENERNDAKTVYYKDMMSLEKNPVKHKEWRDKYIEISAQTYAKKYSEIKFRGEEQEYLEVQKKIANYKKNGVRPPVKLLKKQQEKPSKEKIYKALYSKEKTRLAALYKE